MRVYADGHVVLLAQRAHMCVYAQTVCDRRGKANTTCDSASEQIKMKTKTRTPKQDTHTQTQRKKWSDSKKRSVQLANVCIVGRTE